MKHELNPQIIPILEQLQQEKSQEWRENTMELTQVQFRLDGEIESPDYYRDLLSRIESLGESDEVQLIIDSVGGDLDGCIAICDAIMATPAQVTGILVNRAYSAGAFIALCCDSLEVRPYARMMTHTYRGSFGGKDNEVDSDYNFNKAYIRKFISDCCYGFLSSTELDEMFAGRDFWFNSTEVIERLKRRQEILQAEQDGTDEEDCCGNCCNNEDDCCGECTDSEDQDGNNYEQEFYGDDEEDFST